MKTPLLFNLHSDPQLSQKLCQALPAEPGQLSTRRFPDHETYLRINSDCQGRDVLVFCNLFDPDTKLLPLIFLTDTLRELKAERIGLISPYLGYMRQDKRFQPGECVNAFLFARLISAHVDYLVTVDPHLHRLHSLDQLYDIPSSVVAAAPQIAKWLKQQTQPCVLIGPDSESEQWVAQVAKLAKLPFRILHKERSGDRQVEISKPDLQGLENHRPVLIDDIISSGQTMLKTLQQLAPFQPPKPLCIGVHAVFADDAYVQLQSQAEVVSCNCIPHPSNNIDITELLVEPIQLWLQRR